MRPRLVNMLSLLVVLGFTGRQRTQGKAMRVNGWQSAIAVLRPLNLACLMTCFAAASTAAGQPLDVLESSLRDVFVEVEISTDLTTVGESFGPLHPATYSALGNVGTLV